MLPSESNTKRGLTFKCFVNIVNGGESWTCLVAIVYGDRLSQYYLYFLLECNLDNSVTTVINLISCPL